MEGSNAGGGFLGFSGLFSPHWAFPIVFGVVVVVVVLVVEVERGSGPVSGFGCTRFFCWGAFVLCLYVFQQFWQYRVKQTL